METQGGAQLTREEKVAVIEAYLKGLVSKDISKVPFATDITFEGPRVPPLGGREVVVGFLGIDRVFDSHTFARWRSEGIS